MIEITSCLNKLYASVQGTNKVDGGYWSCDKQLLQLIEEVGELVQAYRKKPKSVSEEIGDVLYVVFSIIGRESRLEGVCKSRTKKNKQVCDKK